MAGLDLAFNRIKDTNGIGELRDLEILDPSQNALSDVSNLFSLDRLTRLWLLNNGPGEWACCAIPCCQLAHFADVPGFHNDRFYVPYEGAEPVAYGPF